MKDLLADLESYFVNGIGTVPALLGRIREARKTLDGIDYWLVWRNGTVTEAKGVDIADAMTKAGYGNGAVSALDYYAKVPYGIEVFNSSATLPDKGTKARDVIILHLVTEAKGLLDAEPKGSERQRELLGLLKEQVERNGWRAEDFEWATKLISTYS